LPIWLNIMKPILELHHISKQFTIGTRPDTYLSLRDIIAKPFKKKPAINNTFLALNDVTFDVYPGESIGIIGRNGAGKSTLLKILSKITPPTKGKIICRGRIASLLEVGTGFHPELTGRENIYMNGSILGMRKHEIEKHFDAIVDFSGVEKFLETPLKRYSSGMQLRLAFAVAAYLEPEILIIDEVLAVGDAEFQKKCLRKMNEVSESGRTVLFVSHDMNAIEQLCTKLIILKKGILAEIGEPHTLISHYLNENKNFDFSNIKLTQNVDLVDLKFNAKEIISGGELNFELLLQHKSGLYPSITDFCILVYSLKGIRVAIIDLRPHFEKFKKEGDKLLMTGRFENINLVEGEYSIGIYYGIDEIKKEILDIGQIRIKPRLNINTKINPYFSKHRGYLELMNNIKID
jgi:ABC-type polysaccharide/polyol phosphate transport system ATPase subunit